MRDTGDLPRSMEAVTRDLGFRYFALIHHDDLSVPRVGRVDIKQYPPAIIEALYADGRFRRDPVFRASLRAGMAFLWSDLGTLVRLNRLDRAALARGAREGLNEGITIPFVRLGDCLGSCTFAGMERPEQAAVVLGAAQLIGVFAFQAALRVSGSTPVPAPPPRLHPRPRDCVVLAGQGQSNKQIARSLALTPRTVDGYLTEARRLFDAHDRASLVAGALLAGEVDLHELRRQPG